MLVLAAVALAGACETSAPFMTFAHTALPVIDGHEKRVLPSAQIVTVTFPGYAHTAEVEAFGDFIGGSAWLKTVGAEYGVGPATHKQKLVWPSASPDRYTDQDLRKMLTTAISDGTLPAPTAGANALAILVYVPATSILDATAAGGGVICLQGSFHTAGGLFTAGYHESFLAPDGTRVPYAVIGDCTSELDEITEAATRELIGMITNPYEVDNTGYLFETVPTDPWLFNLDNGEVGYFCSGEQTHADEGGFTLHRSWSNAAAKAGQEPCVPVPADDVYTNVSADPETLVSAAPGTTLSFQLTGWSTAPTAEWGLLLSRPDGVDYTVARIAAKLSAGSINNGKIVTLTMTVPSTAKSGEYGGVNVLSGPNERVWPVGFTVK